MKRNIGLVVFFIVAGCSVDEPILVSEGGNGGTMMGTGGTAGGGTGGEGGGVTANLVPAVGMRRLSLEEYNQTVADLLGEAPNAGQILPEDPRTPFDNDYRAQTITAAHVSGAELLATDIAARLLADPSRRDKVVGCKPTGPGDAACLRSFVTRFGRRAWRRPLAASEIDDLMTVQTLAQTDNDFYSAVDAVVRSFLMSVEFLYRVEIGTPTAGMPGVFRLNDFEVASRLSYLLWGSMPDDALLDTATRGGLRTLSDIRRVAGEMIGRPAAVARVARFHAMWLRYEAPPASPLGPAMKSETDALVSRVIFETKRPWQDLFRSSETFVSHDLALNYGLGQIPSVGAPGWVSYTGTRRQGILSQASLLQWGADSSWEPRISTRGALFRKTFVCSPVPPEPANLATTIPVLTSPCKIARLKQATQTSAVCAACHHLIDFIGYGLDAYDGLGRWRSAEPDKPTCLIDGEGEFDTVRFNGPAELQAELVRRPELGLCAATHLHRFAMGKSGGDDSDLPFIQLVFGQRGVKDFQFDQLLLDYVSMPSFGYRRVDENQ